jgi:alanine racemase
MAIRQCKRNDAIGYGGAWVCPQDRTIGIVAVGYGDGYPRHASYGTPVLIGKRRVPLIGRVSMDSIFVDLSDYPDAQIGEEAVLWGPGLPVEEIAACANTIPYELLCKVTNRVNFIYE